MLQCVSFPTVLGWILVVQSLKELVNVAPSNPCPSLFGSCNLDHLAQVEISIQLLVKLAKWESLEKEAYTHMVGTVVG